MSSENVGMMPGRKQEPSQVCVLSPEPTGRSWEVLNKGQMIQASVAVSVESLVESG